MNMVQKILPMIGNMKCPITFANTNTFSVLVFWLLSLPAMAGNANVHLQALQMCGGVDLSRSKTYRCSWGKERYRGMYRYPVHIYIYIYIYVLMSDHPSEPISISALARPYNSAGPQPVARSSNGRFWKWWWLCIWSFYDCTAFGLFGLLAFTTK